MLDVCGKSSEIQSNLVACSGWKGRIKPVGALMGGHLDSAARARALS